MRAPAATLRKRGVVERVSRLPHQRVGETAVVRPVVAFACLVCECLKGGAHCGAAFGVEHAAEPDHAASACADGEGAGFDGTDLVLRVALRVVGVTHVKAEVAEASDAELASLAEESRLVEWLVGAGLGDGRSRTCDERQVSEADLAARHGLGAFWHGAKLPPDRHAVRGGAAAHMAVVADPVDGGDRAVRVVLVGAGEARRHLRELELDEVEAPAHLGHVDGELRAGLSMLSEAEAFGGLGQEGHLGCDLGWCEKHGTIVRTNVRQSIHGVKRRRVCNFSS